MNRWITALGGLLVVQIVLALWLNTGEDPYAAFTPEEKLATFETALVDTIRIEAPDKSMVLKRVEGKWKLPELADFPADQQRVANFLNSLANLKRGWPVATTAGAAKRFKVAEEEFERHLTLNQGDKQLANLYFGTSPGFRKVHARVAGEKEIISVPFSLFDAEAEPDRWIDRKVLGLDKKRMTRIKLPGFTLEHKEKGWELARLNPGEQTVTSEADKLADKLAGLTIESVFGADEKPEKEEKTKPLQIEVTLEGDEKLEYTFQKLKDGSYLLRRSDQPRRRFKVAEWEVRPIREAERNKLVEKKPAPGEERETKPDPSKGEPDGADRNIKETPPHNNPPPEESLEK